MTEKALRGGMFFDCYHVHDGLPSPDSFLSAIAFMFRHWGPRVLLLSLLLCLCVKVFFYTIGFIDVLGGVVFFFLRGFVEWWIHAWILHARPLPLLGIRIKTSVYSMHMMHHRQPWKVEGFLFGGVSVAGVLLLLFSFGYFIFGGINYALTVTFVFAFCLFVYEFVHVVCHSRINPKSKFLADILALHRQHHFLDGRKWLGVSSSMADRVIGTDKRRVR